MWKYTKYNFKTCANAQLCTWTMQYEQICNQYYSVKHKCENTQILNTTLELCKYGFTTELSNSHLGLLLMRGRQIFDKNSKQTFIKKIKIHWYSNVDSHSKWGPLSLEIEYWKCETIDLRKQLGSLNVRRFVYSSPFCKPMFSNVIL